MTKITCSASVNGKTLDMRKMDFDTLTAEVKDTHGALGYTYRTLRLSNNGGENSPQIRDIFTLDASFDCCGGAIFHSLNGDNRSVNSFMPYDRVINQGDSFVFEPFGGRSSNTSAFPIFDITFGGHTVLFAVGYTGQWKAEITLRDNTLTVKIGHGYANFYLKPGESVVMPSALFMEAKDGEDAAGLRRRFRQIIVTDMSPLPKGMDHLPISIQLYDRYKRTPKWDMWASYEGQRRVVENLKKCKYIDTLWLDAAWFQGKFPRGVGNYSYADGFPDGLKAVSDAAHENDIKFMLWFEPERVYENTETYNAHPELLLASQTSDFSEKPYQIGNRLVNLGREDAYRYVHDNLARMIREDGIDYYRQDFNMEPLLYWQENDEEDRSGLCEIKHINNLYRLWDELKAEFPGLFIDNCSSGGRRIDLETLRRAVPMWRSDITCRPVSAEEHSDVWNQNITLALSEYLPYNATGAWIPEGNQLRSAATNGVATIFDVLNPAFDFDKAEVALEEVVRLGKYHVGDFYPLTKPTTAEDVFISYQFTASGDGAIYVFRRVDCKDTVYTVKPQAIDTSADYILTVADEDYNKTVVHLSGDEFAKGFDIELPTPQSSATIEYKKA